MMGFYGGYGNFGWIGMVVGMIFWLVVIVGLVILAVWFVRRMNNPTPPAGMANGSGQSAKDIAQLRYAKGEITREEYQRILSDLDR